MQYHLNGLSMKEESINRLQEYEPEEGYYLAFSGGKDSQVLYHLAIEAGVKFDAHFKKTTVDPPELLKFIRDNYPDVIWHHPDRSMFKLIATKRLPPTRVARYCCHYLKEMGGVGRIVLSGVRWEESLNRRSRVVYDPDYKGKKKAYMNPILDWKTTDVWEYLNGNGIEHCVLYDRGYHRIGCILCPMQTKSGKLRDCVNYPKFVNAYMRAFQRMLDKNIHDGHAINKPLKTPFDVLCWWMEFDERDLKKLELRGVFFDDRRMYVDSEKGNSESDGCVLFR